MRFLLPVDARSTRRHETHDGRDGPSSIIMIIHHHSSQLDPNLNCPTMMVASTNSLTPSSNGSSSDHRRVKQSPPTNGGGSGVNNTSLSYTALLFMAMLALQFGIQPIVTQQFTSKNIIKSTVIFMQEVVKLLIGVLGISLGKTSWSDVTAGELMR